MITVYMRGRLGNQLFQYAFARSLQLSNPSQEIIYNFSEVYENNEPDNGWENSLRYFNVVDVNTAEKDYRLTLKQRLLLKSYFVKYPHASDIKTINDYQMKWVKLLNKNGLFYLDLGYYPFEKVIKTRNAVVSGNFESERFFADIKEQIINEITPIHPERRVNKELYDAIRNTESVCISVRRGDFVTNSSIKKLLNICSKDYFEKGIETIKSKVNNPVWIIFSDDIEWAKANICPGNNCYYESGNDPVWEKLRLMYNCKHFIISNSTFSWWSQYLSRNPEKIVIAPKKWYNSDLVPDLYLSNWICI